MGAVIPWPEDAQKRALALWAEGVSASAISRALSAEKLHAVTRNAVLGFINRRVGPRGGPGALRPQPGNDLARAARLKARAEANARKAVAAQERARQRREALGVSASARTAARRAEPLAAALDESGAPLAPSVLHLKEPMCKWPIGEVGAADFAFCARARFGERPYCAHHAALAYAPGSCACTKAAA
jgi:GcrA cell cycle regulator